MSQPEAMPLSRDPDRGLGLALFLIFLGLYLFVSGRQPPVGDAVPVWELARSLIERGSFVIETQWNVALGSDGQIYSGMPLLASLVHLPGAALHLVAAQSEPLAAHLAPAVLGAWTCVLFFRLARRFVGRTAAGLSTAFVGLATAVACYARIPYGGILQTFGFTGFALALVGALDDPDARAGRRLGLWAGLLVHANATFALALPGAALIFVWRLRREPRRLASFGAWAAGVLVLLVLPLLAYNWMRFGAPTGTGTPDLLPGSLWRGLWGLAFSPGKSVFFYNPPLFLAVFGLPALFRRAPAFVFALFAAALPVVFAIAHVTYWDGDWAWGPRFLTPLVPVACVPLALVIEGALTSGRRLLALAVAAALTAGVCVQLLGAAFAWDHWIRISAAASESWLAMPPRCGPPDRREPCPPQGNRLYALHWLPQLSPIAGHVWLLRHVPFQDPYNVAELDAPWQFEGKIHIPKAAGHYADAALDWWALDWKPVAAIVVGAMMLASAMAGAALWRRRARP